MISDKFASVIGMALVLAGALLLIGGYVAGWTSSNLLLLIGLLLIVLGVILHVRQQKKRDKY